MARLIWLVAVVFIVSPLARAEPNGSAAPRQMWLVLSPEEHFCAGPSSSWHDPSDPLLLAAASARPSPSVAPVTRMVCSG